jgi:hypothetical protein
MAEWVERRLTTILSVDIAVYSWLMRAISVGSPRRSVELKRRRKHSRRPSQSRWPRSTCMSANAAEHNHMIEAGTSQSRADNRSRR